MTTLGKYRILELIGKGSYGNVFKVKHIENNNIYALKIDKKNKKSLFNEIYILDKLRKIENIPKIIDYNLHEGLYYFVMERLGITLEDYFYINNFKQSQFIKFIVDTMYIIKNIQQNGIIHRDIKPDNIILNRDNNKIFIIDFGISKKYLDKYKNHKKNNFSKKITGTVRYASIFNHEGNDLSRRDDIISFLYSIIFILNRGLPWQNMNDNCRFLKILNKKKNISNEKLCEFLHKNFCELLNYSYSLNFNEEPDYDYIILTLSNINNLYVNN